MQTFNAITSWIFDILLAPLGHRLAAFDLLLWPVLAGIVALLVYKRVSNQAGIARAKTRIQVHLLEIVLYRDDLPGILSSTAKALWQNARYLAYNFVPMLVMLAPMTVILVQLVSNYAYDPLPAGSRPLLEVSLADDAPVKSTDVTLELPPGVSLDAPPVRTPRGEIVWRLRADEPGDHALRLTVTSAAGSETLEKILAVGGEPRKIPVMRAHGFDAFLYPAEPALASDSAFDSIRVKYPDRELRFFPDGEGGVLAWFFLFSLAAGFALKDRFGVTL